MKSALYTGLSIAFISFLLPTAISAETRLESEFGTITKIDTLTTSFTRKTPRNEQICSIQDVPIYGQAEQSDGLGSIIVGGLIGSAIGNSISDSNGSGAAGAVAGALLGHSHAKAASAAENGRIIGYRQQEVCHTNRIIEEEQITRITGYRLNVEADDGNLITLETSTPREIGDRIELRKRVSYSLK